MKAERFTAGIFLCVITGMLALAICSFIFLHAERSMDDRPAIKIDWEKLYPFEEDKKDTTSASAMSSFYDYVKERLQRYVTENLLGYHKIVETAKKYEDALCWNMVSVFDYNAVIKLKDGYLTSYTMSLDIMHDAEAVKELSDFCEERGIDFMYINFPAKICKSEDKEISGVLDFANQNADKLLDMLKEAGVKNYDFRKNLHEAGMKHHESFYVTDHHWKAETGLWAAGEILKILRDDWGWNVKPEILSPENFDYVIYRDWFLGSQGQKMTLARAKPEDFTMIYPKFSTSIKFEVPSLGLKVSGDFGITYDMEQVESLDYYGRTPYSAYHYGEKPLIRAENGLIEDEKSILVIRDSFCDCVIPFLLLEVQHVDTINLRFFTGSIRNFIGTEHPNAVIVVYYSKIPGRYSNTYDFR